MFTEGIAYTLKNENIESLRLILQHEQNQPINHDEAQSIGESLISFFSTLAEDDTDSFEED
jgi:hypothetical protein